MLLKVSSSGLAIDQAARWPLHSVADTRQLEQQMAAQLPAHELMRRAGQSIAKMAKAVAPHAQSIWIACGPGNNGGDGLMAAVCLQDWAHSNGIDLHVTWAGNEATMPEDARFALNTAVAVGIRLSDIPPPACDLAIDALLGLGGHGRAFTAQSRTWQLYQHLQTCSPLLLCVDVPTGLCADTGSFYIANNSYASNDKKIFCLTFLTIKPGLFTANGRDCAGEVWWDDLGHNAMRHTLGEHPPPCAWLGTPPRERELPSSSRHNTHKGDFGDVWVLGGSGLEPDGAAMVGAGMLAAKAALHARAGRVYVAMRDAHSPGWDCTQPELMLHSASTLLSPDPLPRGAWICGCGGGSGATDYLPKLLLQAEQLVLDADALNAIARSQDLADALAGRVLRGQVSVITPHPLEAARLLASTTPQVQSDRLRVASELAHRFKCVAVLKGSGTVIASPTGTVVINGSGNGRLSTAGTGDVLAGMLGGTLSSLLRGRVVSGYTLSNSDSSSFDHWVNDCVLPLVCEVVFQHGQVADQWRFSHTLTAGALAGCFTPPTSARFAATGSRREPTGPRHPPRE